MVAQAQAAGAAVTMAPQDAFWGSRYARLRDPFGHIWAFNAPLPKAVVPKATVPKAAG